MFKFFIFSQCQPIRAVLIQIFNQQENKKNSDEGFFILTVKLPDLENCIKANHSA